MLNQKTWTDIYKSIKDELEQQASDRTISQKELAGAFITAAYIEISPKVEKIRDIVELWQSISDKIPYKTQWDYIGSILSTGRIKDMDIQHLITREDMMNINKKIRKELKKVVGK